MSVSEEPLLFRRIRPYMMEVSSVRGVIECNKIPAPAPIFLIEDKAIFFTIVSAGRGVMIVYARGSDAKDLVKAKPSYLIQDKEGNMRPSDKPSRAPEEVSFPVVRVKYQDLIPEW